MSKMCVYGLTAVTVLALSTACSSGKKGTDSGNGDSGIGSTEGTTDKSCDSGATLNDSGGCTPNFAGLVYTHIGFAAIFGYDADLDQVVPFTDATNGDFPITFQVTLMTDLFWSGSDNSQICFVEATTTTPLSAKEDWVSNADSWGWSAGSGASDVGEAVEIGWTVPDDATWTTDCQDNSDVGGPNLTPDPSTSFGTDPVSAVQTFVGSPVGWGASTLSKGMTSDLTTGFGSQWDTYSADVIGGGPWFGASEDPTKNTSGFEEIDYGFAYAFTDLATHAVDLSAGTFVPAATVEGADAPVSAVYSFSTFYAYPAP